MSFVDAFVVFGSEGGTRLNFPVGLGDLDKSLCDTSQEDLVSL